MINEKTKHQKNLENLTNKIYKFLHGLSSPVINDIFGKRGNINNLRNFQPLYTTCIKNARSWTETVTHRGPQIQNLIPDKVKNVYFLENFKRKIKSGKAYSIHVQFVKQTFLQNIGFI